MFNIYQPFRNIENHPNKEPCFIQVSELKVENCILTCDRDVKVIPPKNLVPVDGEWGQKKIE